MKEQKLPWRMPDWMKQYLTIEDCLTREQLEEAVNYSRAPGLNLKEALRTARIKGAVAQLIRMKSRGQIA